MPSMLLFGLPSLSKKALMHNGVCSQSERFASGGSEYLHCAMFVCCSRKYFGSEGRDAEEVKVWTFSLESTSSWEARKVYTQAKREREKERKEN